MSRVKLAFALLGLLLAGAVLLVWVKARAHEARTEAAFPPEGRIVTVDGHQVHAVVMGQGPDLVLIHGSSGNTRDMTFSLAPALSEAFRVIVIDRPGLGYTDRIDRTGASIARQAGLISAAARELGAERPIVLGHSYGGAVALAWAVNHPDRLSGLVALAAPSHPWQSGLSTYYRLLSNPVLGRLAIPLITAFVPDARVAREVAQVFAPDAMPAGYLAHFGPGLALRRASLRANALQRAGLLGEIEALAPRYGEIGVPTEILHGTADSTVGLSIHAEPLAAAIPGARLTRLEGAGHMIQHSEEAAVVAAVARVARRAGLRPGG